MGILVKQRKLVKYQVGSYGEMNKRGNRDVRTAIIFGFFVFFVFAIFFRLVKLQILEHGYYVALASGQHEIFRQLIPVRGTIFAQDKAGVLVNRPPLASLATNKKMNLLYAVPKDVKDPEATIEMLKEVFNIKEATEEEEKRLVAAQEKKTTDLDTTTVKSEKTEQPVQLTKEQLDLQKKREAELAMLESWRRRLAKKESQYAVIKHFVSDEDIAKIKQFNLAGIAWTDEMTRYYPEKNIGSQMLGFVGKQAENNLLKGSYGIEGCYDKQLAGTAGFLRSESDISGRWIATAKKDLRSAEDGNNIILTVDKSIEYFACDALNKAVIAHEAETGSVIVYEPQTGKILALCNSPDFDPNKYNEAEDLKVFNNLAITESYEPGSVFKVMTLAAGIDSGKVNPFSTYIDPGELKIDGFSIFNSDRLAHGVQTMTQVLEKSLNTGTVYVANQVGREEFLRYVKAFGFGQKTGVDLCQEEKGNIKALDKKGAIFLATASFGQGISATPLQLVRAFGAIANQGNLMQPYIVDSIVDKDGKVIQKTVPKIMSQAVSSQTAKLVSSMMVSVLQNSHSKKGQISGYLMAGKTGTAQIPDLKKGGYSDKTAHTFIGFGPNNNPRFVILTELTAPKEAYAESTALPLFTTIAKYIIQYYAIPPEVK
jgi:cell division protein FtsI/penicillin-binding protein 2